MSDTTVPAAEAEGVAIDERNSYELAFHVLPTVAEGEVPTVFEAIKADITKLGGELFDEEAPQRFDLAYEIVKHLEGKNRRFTSAYFGWVRFKAASDSAEHVLEAMESNQQILRHLLIKLTKVEEEHPFRFHEALAAEKVVTDVDETSASSAATAPTAETAEAADAEPTAADTADTETEAETATKDEA